MCVHTSETIETYTHVYNVVFITHIPHFANNVPHMHTLSFSREKVLTCSHICGRSSDSTLAVPEILANAMQLLMMICLRVQHTTKMLYGMLLVKSLNQIPHNDIERSNRVKTFPLQFSLFYYYFFYFFIIIFFKLTSEFCQVSWWGWTSCAGVVPGLWRQFAGKWLPATLGSIPTHNIHK